VRPAEGIDPINDDFPVRTAQNPSMKNRYAYLISAVAALGGFLFGFDTAIVNGALVFLKREFALNNVQTEWAAGSLLAGCIAGTAVAGALGDRRGRKWPLLLSAALFAVAAIGAAVPQTLAQFVVARVAGGIAIGLVSTLVPLYIAEIAPATTRGRMVTFYQLAIVIGIVVAYFVSAILAPVGTVSWRWMFASAAIPSVIFLGALIPLPESPRWLVQRSRTAEALTILMRVEDVAGASARLREIEQAISEERASLKELLAPTLRPAVFIGCGLACLCQITGINTILYYGALIFTEQARGHSDASALQANVTIGFINFLATVITLAAIDSWGRKKLLLWSSGGMAICLLLLGLSLRLDFSSTVSLVFILAFVGFFAIGMGPVVWVIISEIFPTKIRGRAISICTVVLWSSCLLVTVTFLSLMTALGAAVTFWTYALLSFLTFVFIFRFVPETKGRALEVIQQNWLKTATVGKRGR
jgi:sugar porter (SP) family MFS transporter